MKKLKVVISMLLVLITLTGVMLIPVNAKSFSDVPSNAWFAESVYWCYDHGLVAGYGDGTFKPNKSVTRAEFSQILYSAALNLQSYYGDYRIIDNPTKKIWVGSNTDNGEGMGSNVCARYGMVLKKDMEKLSSKKCPYSDVYSGIWYADAVRWCYHKGLYDDMFTGSKFYPGKVLTREQAITMFFRWWFAVTQVYKVDYKNWITNGLWPWQEFDHVDNSCKKITNYDYSDRCPGSNPKYLARGLAKNKSTYNKKKDAMYVVFTDAGQISDYAVPAMVWAVSSDALKARTNDDFSWGFLSGTGQYILSPKGELTRAQVVTIFRRVFEDLAPGEQPWWSLV